MKLVCILIVWYLLFQIIEILAYIVFSHAAINCKKFICIISSNNISANNTEINKIINKIKNKSNTCRNQC